MPKLTKLIPPDEAVVWRSPAMSWAMPLLIAMATPAVVLAIVGGGGDISPTVAVKAMLLSVLFIALLVWLSRATEVAVTERHVVWRRIQIPFSRGAIDSFGVVALDRIRSADVYAGSGDARVLGNAVVLDLDGGETARIARVDAGRVEEMAAAMRRPARIWRQRESPSADRARQWRVVTSVILGMVAYMTLTFTFDLRALYLVEPGSSGWLSGFSGLTNPALVLAVLIAVAGRAILPHLVVGRRLPPKERRDFVCTLADPLWEGKERDPAGPAYRLFRRLESWVMRKAYGEMPDCGTIEPKVIGEDNALPAGDDRN